MTKHNYCTILFSQSSSLLVLNMDCCRITYGEDIDFYTSVENIKIYCEQTLKTIDLIRDMDVEDITKNINEGKIVIPMKPKKLLDTLIASKNKKHSTPKTFEEIHKYLLKHLQTNININAINFPSENNLEEIKIFLKTYNITIKKSKAFTFYLHSAFGYFLDIFFNQYTTNNKDKPWKDFIKKHFNISDGHGRKLRIIGRLVSKYPKLKLLSIKFEDFWKIHIDVEKMINHEDYKQFWI